MENFEVIIESWICGNRSYVWEEYLKLSPGKRYDFIEYLKSAEDKKLVEDILSTFLKNFISNNHEN